MIKYEWLSKQTFKKIKPECISSDLLLISNPQPLLKTLLESSIISHYTLDNSNTHILKVSSKESHVLYTAANGEIGGELEAEQTLTLKGSESCSTITANTLQEAVAQIEGAVTQETLTTEPQVGNQSDQKQFTNSVSSFRDFLQPKSLGTLQSAKAFVHLVRVARRSNKEDISKALGSKKNQPIL